MAPEPVRTVLVCDATAPYAPALLPPGGIVSPDGATYRVDMLSPERAAAWLDILATSDVALGCALVG
jgi:hypothetical protein